MRFEHIQNVNVSAVFSPDRKFRYRLTVEKPGAHAGKTVCVIMQNPSVANEDQADKSVQFLEKLVFEKNCYSELQGCSKLVIVNQYAHIQTNDFDGTDDLIGTDNDAHIKKALDESDIIVIAWGSANGYAGRQKHILGMIGKKPGKPVYKSKAHPSRAGYGDFLIPFDAE